MENMHTDVRLYSVPGSLSCTFRKATSVKKEESSKAKKNRRPISLDSGREMMCTYWGCPILFMWRVIGRFYFHGNHDFIFFFFVSFFVLFRELWLKMIRSFHVLVNNFFFIYLNITCEWRMKWIKSDWQTILFNWQILGYFKEPNL